MNIGLIISKNLVSGKIFNLSVKVNNKEEIDCEYNNHDIEVLEIVDSLFKYKNIRLYGNTVDTLVADDFAFSHAKVRGLMGYNDLIAKNNAFSHSDIEEISNISYADVAAFYNSSLHKVSFKDISYIGDKAFSRTNISELNLFGKDVELGNNIFSSCKNLVEVQTNLEYFSDGIFSGCINLSNIDLSEVKIFGSKSLNKTGVKKIRLDSAVYIGNRAFADCYELEEIYIGADIRYIHKDAFIFCKNLRKIVLPERMRGILEENKYFFCAKIEYYNNDSEEYIKSDDGKKIIGVDIESDTYYIDSDIEEIDFDKDGFEDANIIFSNGLKKIGNKSFINCKIINNIPNSIEYIGIDAFNGAKYRSTLRIPSCLKIVGESAFRGIITHNLIIGDNVEIIEKGAFADSSIVSVKIGRGIKKIARGVFKNTLIESLYIPPQVSDIDSNAFEHMNKLKTLYISEAHSKMINSKLKDKFVIYDKFD